MFTGIVAEAGMVEAIQMAPHPSPLPRRGRGRTPQRAPTRGIPTAIRLAVRCNLARNGLKVGESIAVNGCCLTVVQVRSRERLVQFDLLRETWRRTNLQFLKGGSLVNLEPPLRPGGPLDG